MKKKNEDHAEFTTGTLDGREYRRFTRSTDGWSFLKEIEKITGLKLKGAELLEFGSPEDPEETIISAELAGNGNNNRYIAMMLSGREHPMTKCPEFYGTRNYAEENAIFVEDDEMNTTYQEVLREKAEKTETVVFRPIDWPENLFKATIFTTSGYETATQKTKLSKWNDAAGWVEITATEKTAKKKEHLESEYAIFSAKQTAEIFITKS